MKMQTKGPIQIHFLPDGPVQANTWLIDSGEATCIIDPILRPSRMPHGLSPVRWILATHGHFDHIGRADEWRDCSGAPLLIHAADADALTDAAVNLSTMINRPETFRPAEGVLQDGWELEIGPGIRLQALHTPGHTVGSSCFLLTSAGEPIALFTGDTLFAGSIGRTDLGGNPLAMQQSLQRLAGLTGQLGRIPVYPGHGPATTLARELANNPWLQNIGQDFAGDLARKT